MRAAVTAAARRCAAARRASPISCALPTHRFLSVEAQAGAPEPQVLANALRHVGQHGWTVEALAAGAIDLGFPPAAHGLFPRGAVELVDFFMDQCHDELRATLAANAEALQAMRVADRLKFGVRARLELLAPVLTTWPQAMALGALPPNAPTTAAKLAKLADEIWYFAGDQSADASWYTKRALLTGIYASTELFLLADRSPGFADTWAFLDRRVDESIALGELPQNLGDVTAMAGIALQSFVSAATSLAGPLSSQILAQSPLAGMPNPIAAAGSMPSSV
ncbi:hypothetical protein PybrP1_009797 [[Pythium] brassicae (nom. inval.)]|nr:hypothetical protein PybrP1_009797 [[Pythium] brassicae (nom. inval.)]